MMIRCCLVLFLMYFPFQTQAKPVSEFSVDNYKNQVVYLDFWASWCSPCLLSFPWMIEMQKKYEKDGLKIVTINVDREKKDGDRFLRRFKINFPVFYDPKMALADQLEVESIPTSFLYNKEGKLISKHVGFDSKKAEKYEKELRSLLGLD